MCVYIYKHNFFLFSPVAGHCLNNTAQPEGLSRSAQMLMVAQENAGKYATNKRYKPSSNSSWKPLFFSEMKAQKESLSVCLFLIPFM